MNKKSHFNRISISAKDQSQLFILKKINIVFINRQHYSKEILINYIHKFLISKHIKF